MFLVVKHLFLHPYFLPALLVLPILAVLAWRAARRRRIVFAQFGHWPSVQAMVASRRHFRWLRLFCLTWGLMALGVASAGPQWGQDPTEATALGRDLVVVLDVSRSMQAEQPSRLNRAVAALNDLVDSLRQRGGNRIALVAFAGQAKTVCPLTHDYDHFKETLDSLDAEQLAAELRPVGNTPSGTRIGAGIEEALAILDWQNQDAQDIILLSDGDDPVPDNEWLEGAKAAKARNVPVHAVGVGDPDADSLIPGVVDKEGNAVRSRLIEKPLQEIANRTGGFYESAQTRVVHLGKRYRDEVKNKATRESREDTLPVYRQRAAWFFGLALGLLTLELFLAALPEWRRKSSAASGVA
jgi:Ca-activated chloride channel family protein